MNLEEIEMKASVHHRTDELEKITAQMPDCLKKRVRNFINTEVRALGDRIIAMRGTDDIEGLLKAYVEVNFMDKLSSIHEQLPDK